MNKIECIRLKLDRAEEHIEHFKDRVLGRKGPVYPLHGVSMTYLPNLPTIEIGTTALDPRQCVELGIVVGDVIHQTRTALDHLASAIAVARRYPMPLTNKERKNLSFLIATILQISNLIGESRIGSLSLS
jgi:hypothetical protein